MSELFNSAGADVASATIFGFSNGNGFSLTTSPPGWVMGSIDALRSISAGASSGNASGLTFANSNGVSFGWDGTNVTASVGAGAGGVALSAGANSTSAGTVVFSNSNGVSFGMDGAGVVTGSVQTDYQPPGAYLTTAMQSNAATISNIKVSAGASSANVSAVTFQNSNGVSFGYDGTNITATVATNYQPPGAYLTTAALSQDSSKYAGVNGAITGGSITVNTSGVSVNLPAYLTTARASNDAIGLNTALTGNGVAWTVNSSGLSLNVPAFLTTAMASNRGSDFVQANATIAGTNISGTIASNGLSLSVGAYLTTAMASNRGSDFVQANATFAGTSCSGTIASNGISVSVGPYLTTADLSQNSSKYAGINGAITGGSITVNTSGVSVNLPAYLTTAMASNAATISNINVSAGAASANLSALVFSNSNGVSFGLNGSTITASAAGGGGGAGYTLSYFEPLDFQVMSFGNIATTTYGQGTLHLQPFVLQAPLTFDRVNMMGSNSFLTTNNTAYAFEWTLTNNSAVSSVSASCSFGYTNAHLVDLFLFSNQAGGSSTDLAMVGSTRASIVTYISETGAYFHTKTATNVSLTYTVSQGLTVSVTYPALTSGTLTSVNAGTTVTTWQMGYSLWTISSSRSAQVATLASNASTTTGFLSTAYPNAGTSGWASYKMLYLPFASSLSAGSWWFGIRQSMSTSSGVIQSGATNTSPNNNAVPTIIQGIGTATGNFTFVGCTNTLASSLGLMGGGTFASLAPSPGHGTFTATYDPTKTYYNNAGQAAGEIALSDINTEASFWKGWFAMGSNRL